MKPEQLTFLTQKLKDLSDHLDFEIKSIAMIEDNVIGDDYIVILIVHPPSLTKPKEV